MTLAIFIYLLYVPKYLPLILYADKFYLLSIAINKFNYGVNTHYFH